MRNRRFLRAVAVVCGLSLLAAACGDDEEPESEGTTTTTEGEAPAEGGELAGMKGTTPLVDLSDEFKDRLLEVNADLEDFNYAAESYDATVIIALAVALAEDDGIAYASEIN